MTTHCIGDNLAGCGRHTIKVAIGRRTGSKIYRTDPLFDAVITARDSERVNADMLHGTGSGMLQMTGIAAATRKKFDDANARSIPQAIAAVATANRSYTSLWGTDSIEEVASNLDKYFTLYYYTRGFWTSEDHSYTQIRARPLTGKLGATTWGSLDNHDELFFTYVPKAVKGAVPPPPRAPIHARVTVKLLPSKFIDVTAVIGPTTTRAELLDNVLEAVKTVASEEELACLRYGTAHVQLSIDGEHVAADAKLAHTGVNFSVIIRTDCGGGGAPPTSVGVAPLAPRPTAPYLGGLGGRDKVHHGYPRTKSPSPYRYL